MGHFLKTEFCAYFSSQFRLNLEPNVTVRGRDVMFLSLILFSVLLWLSVSVTSHSPYRTHSRLAFSLLKTCFLSVFQDLTWKSCFKENKDRRSSGPWELYNFSIRGRKGRGERNWLFISQLNRASVLVSRRQRLLLLQWHSQRALKHTLSRYLLI